jgi:hypothetical protein
MSGGELLDDFEFVCFAEHGGFRIRAAALTG